ncbi:MAG: hypothetical protein MJZ34_12845 [Paludibacteraceae bacterium]|nr:hypothetical protein [Paludibacteraceae bacterium]
MKYSKLVKQRKQYKYSANLSFDIKNADRIEGFIPNATTTDILSEYLYSIIAKTNDVHSRILYGSYGTGKSHLLTVLCAILGLVNTNGSAFDQFKKSLCKCSPELVSFIEDFINDNKPFLVVPVSSDFSEFDKCISFSLKRELEKNGIEVCFKSYYQDALVLLKGWTNGNESRERLSEICEKKGIDCDELVTGLENYDHKSEKVFSELFKSMTYGASFVSSTGNLADNISMANEAICGKYRGIVFVFDEFGRYVEDEGENIKVKAIQDLAEFCDHSDYNDYLILVSHKQLSLYTDKMKKDVSEEWKKVEGRFKATSINIKYDQCLSLISHIIPKADSWEKFKEKYETELNELYNQAWEFKGFLLPPEGGNPFEGGYPLHPITLYALDRLSKRVAQNERTFFTFLAGDEENSLFSILSKLDDSKFHFVGLDSIFDYFEDNIRSFRGSDVYEVYKKYQFACNKLSALENSIIEQKILKTMAVMDIIADMSVLCPDEVSITNVIDADKGIIEKAMRNLEKLKVIKYMRQYGFYDFLDSSIYDLDAMIEEKAESVNEDMVVNVLNEEFAQFVVYPYDYNLAYHINRIFIPRFAYRSDLSKKNILRGLPEYYDGVLSFVLDDERGEGLESIDENLERFVFLVNSDTSDLVREVKRYLGVKYYFSKKDELKQDDPTVEKELQIYLVEQYSLVADYVQKWKTLKNRYVEVFALGKRQKVDSEMALSTILSQVMYEAFPDTIIVNNDLISKNNVSGAIRLARSKALSFIFEDENIFENCTPLSPEHSILRSVLSKNHLVDDESVSSFNILPWGKNAGKESSAPISELLNKYIRKWRKAPAKLADLYDEMKKAPYGLRDGYIPVLIAWALKDFKNVSLYFHSSEKDYDADNLLAALASPDDYTIYICEWTENQEKYISELENIFADKLVPSSKNRLKDLFSAMNIHYSSISKAARTTDKFVSDQTKTYRDILSLSYKDYNKFFFEVLMKINNDILTLGKSISLIRSELEGVTERQLDIAKKITRKVFDIPSDMRISVGIRKIYEMKWEEKSHKLFDYQTNAFLEFIKNANEAEVDDDFVQSLSRVITGFEIEYWNDSKASDYEEVLNRIFATVEAYEVTEELAENEVRISIMAGGNETKTTRFGCQELSPNSKTMMNKMKATIENFGGAISQEEKVQILVSLLNDII